VLEAQKFVLLKKFENFSNIMMTKKFISILSIVLPGLVIILGVLQFILVNELAGYGSEVQAINQKISILSDENELLTKQVAIANSLTVISEKALASGFIKLKNFITITDIQQVALNQNVR
jgi:hypothetical protein